MLGKLTGYFYNHIKKIDYSIFRDMQLKKHMTYHALLARLPAPHCVIKTLNKGPMQIEMGKSLPSANKTTYSSFPTLYLIF